MIILCVGKVMWEQADSQLSFPPFTGEGDISEEPGRTLYLQEAPIPKQGPPLLEDAQVVAAQHFVTPPIPVRVVTVPMPTPQIPKVVPT